MSNIPSSDSSGAKVFSIAGRMVEERERMYHRMNEQERKWRAQWIQDQYLSPTDGHPEKSIHAYRARYNILRRFYRWPLDKFQDFLTPRLGFERALSNRTTLGRILMTIYGIYATMYYMKYNTHDWERRGGWDFYLTRPALLPGDENYPNAKTLTEEELYDRGFSKSPIYPKA